MSGSKVHLIYTGGTIGMMEHPESGRLTNVDLDQLSKEIPELNQLDVELTTSAFMDPIDSCDMTPGRWRDLARYILERSEEHDGFVVLHGSDTMAYTASALSYLLCGLKKPVILTGSQLPIGALRTDGKENLLTSVEIAGRKKNGEALVQEVAVYFEYKLFRGNRTIKVNAERFEAFRSPNWPALAEAGVQIKFDRGALLTPQTEPSNEVVQMQEHVVLVQLFPGMDPGLLVRLANNGTKAMVMASFGAGNVPSLAEFLQGLREVVDSGITVINVTQCSGGSVIQGRYGASKALEDMGVISGYDLTVEAAVTKLMYLQGAGVGADRIGAEMQRPICGELTLSQL